MRFCQLLELLPLFWILSCTVLFGILRILEHKKKKKKNWKVLTWHASFQFTSMMPIMKSSLYLSCFGVYPLPLFEYLNEGSAGHQ